MARNKRIVFTLLYADGHFVLSRNFRLQRIGDIEWLDKNYNFSRVSRYIDELVVLNVSRTEDIDWPLFVNTVGQLAHRNFVPISVGGFSQKMARGEELLRTGADKLVLNTALFENRPLVEEIVATYGRQVVVGSLDFGLGAGGQPSLFIHKGSVEVEEPITGALSSLPSELVGELYLQSISRDGTGQGLNLNLIGLLPKNLEALSLIICGGVGKPEHIADGLSHPAVRAVATANLLNFIGDGLRGAREQGIDSGIELASWVERHA